MAIPLQGDTLSLDVTRTLDATPEEVFAAWTSPRSLALWFAPSAQMATTVHQLDARVGGRYRIEMREPGGKVHICAGEYVTVDAPRRLAFTWAWETGDGEETLVEVSLRAVATGCELSLRHSRFSNEQRREGHRAGWEGCLGRLPSCIAH